MSRKIIHFINFKWRYGWYYQNRKVTTKVRSINSKNEIKTRSWISSCYPTEQNYIPWTSWERPQKTFYELLHMVLNITPRDVPYQRLRMSSTNGASWGHPYMCNAKRRPYLFLEYVLFRRYESVPIWSII